MTKELSFRWLLTAQFINNFAFGFMWPMATIYMHGDLNQSLITIGWVMLANSLGQAMGSLVGGRLFDKFKPYTLINAGVLVMIAIQTFLIFFHGWPVYAFGFTLVGIVAGWNMALLNSFGTQITTHNSRVVFNMLYFTNNFGIVLATATVSLIFPLGATWLFVASLILYLMLIVVTIFKFPKVTHSLDVSRNTIKEKVPKFNLIMIYSFVIGLFLTWVVYAQWTGTISVYITSNLDLPLWKYSILWTINGAMVLLMQVLINWLDLSSRKKAIWFQIFGGILTIAISFGLLLVTKTFTGLVVAMIILTIGEVTAFPMIPVLVNEITPMTVKGKYQGIVAAAPSLGRAMAPMAGGIMVENHGYRSLFYTGSFVGLLICLALMLVSFFFVSKITWFNNR